MNCPKCSSKMILRTSRAGDQFYGCPKFPKCRGTLPYTNGVVQGKLKKLSEYPSPSKYQFPIINKALQYSKSDKKVYTPIRSMACPGSGKTTLLGMAMAAILEYDPQADVVCATFNAHIRDAGIKAGLPMQTVHQLSFAAIRKWAGNNKVKVDDDKVVKIVKTLINDTWEADKFLISPVVQIVSKVKNVLCGTDNESLDEVCELFRVETNGDRDRIFELVRLTLEENDRQKYIIDFDDMGGYFVWRFDIPVEKHQYVLGDEVQDWNRSNLLFMLRTIKDDSFVLMVGDENQCQPAGTKVLVSDKPGNRWNGGPTFKEIDIEDIKEGDTVVSYSGMYGCFIHTGKVLKTSKSLYKGDLIGIRTIDDKFHEVTPGHICITKWKSSVKRSFCVYLMQKGDRFRVGLTFMFDKVQGNGAVHRLATEKADKVWILGIFDNKSNAVIEEQFISYKYGIPQTRFEGCNEYVPGYDTGTIDGIFDKLLKCVDLEKRARLVLLDYGFDIDYPIYTSDPCSRLGVRGLQQVYASNLFPEYMQIASIDSSKVDSKSSLSSMESFVDFKVEKKYFEGYVYGLDIQDHHTYISNGILTHNSIYGFRGADIEGMAKLKAALKAEDMPLGITYRCPKKIVAYINQLFPHILFEAWDQSPEGEILEMSYDKMLGLVKDGDLVLCRTNAPLVKPVFQLIRQGVKAIIRGRDIGANLISLIEKMQATKTLDLIEKLVEYKEKEVARLLKAEKSGQAQSLDDKVETILAIAEGTDYVSEIIRKIDEVFSDKKQGVCFSSIHKAKGDEAKTVYVLHPELCPHPMAQTERELKQEYNLWLVRDTRALHTLVFVGKGIPTVIDYQKPEEIVEKVKSVGWDNLEGDPEVVEHIEEILQEADKDIIEIVEDGDEVIILNEEEETFVIAPKDEYYQETKAIEDAPF